MAKNGVDGVYDDDPKTNPNAKKIDRMSYDDIIKKDLKVMDTSACALCKQNKIPIIVFDFNAKGSLTRIMDGEAVRYLCRLIIFEYKRRKLCQKLLKKCICSAKRKWRKQLRR